MDKDVEGATEALTPLFEVDTRRRLEGAVRRMRTLNRVLQSQYAGSAQASDLTSRINTFLSSVHENSKELPEGS